jgi:predicted GIY-YIG superfamily endonuclease
MKSHYVYILKCADGSYYTGSTDNLEMRFEAHQSGADPRAYTYHRRPVELVWSGEFPTENSAFQFEHQIKGWNRAKKEALILADWEGIHDIVYDERRKREPAKRDTKVA